MSLIDKAKAIVDVDRQSEYGDPVENAERQAAIASAMLGRTVTALECNTINIAQKMVRMGRGYREDTFIDVIGYTEIRARIIAKETKTDKKLECIFCERPAVDKLLIYCSEHDLESRRITSGGELGA